MNEMAQTEAEILEEQICETENAKNEIKFEETKVEENAEPKQQRMSKSEKREIRLKKRMEYKKLQKKEKKLLKRSLKAQMSALDENCSESKGDQTNLEPLPPQSILPTRKQVAKHGVRMRESNCRTRIVLDCNFDSLHSEKDVMHLYNQICAVYGMNRRSKSPVQLSIAGINVPPPQSPPEHENDEYTSKLLRRMNSIGPQSNPEYKNWDLNIYMDDFSHHFEQSEIVYLCAEADNELIELRDDCVYVIGGLVDHNHHKAYCFNEAKRREFRVARLPISECDIKINSRSVLSIVHVFQSLLKKCEGLDWRTSLLEAIPSRKIRE